MRAQPNLNRLRIAFTVFVIVTGPVFWAYADEPEASVPPDRDVVTMPGMKSLVPTLTALAWENFFLEIRKQLDLSEDQVQELYRIRLKYVESEEELRSHLEQAQNMLYNDLDADVVSCARLKDELERIADLKAALSSDHFAAILEAINVLNHAQHLSAAKWFKLRQEMWKRLPLRPDKSFELFERAQVQETRQQWPSNFTPQELYWRAW